MSVHWQRRMAHVAKQLVYFSGGLAAACHSTGVDLCFVPIWTIQKYVKWAVRDLKDVGPVTGKRANAFWRLHASWKKREVPITKFQHSLDAGLAALAWAWPSVVHVACKPELYPDRRDH